MKIIRNSLRLSDEIGPCAVTIGNFDGFHLGHRLLVQTTIERARHLSVPAGLLTFDPHPVQMLAPHKKLKRIFPIQDLVECAEGLGLDFVVIESFSRDFSERTADDFLNSYLRPRFQPQSVVVGYDFNFGAGRSGSPESLKLWGQSNNISVDVIPQFQFLDDTVSSSRIRKLIAAGDVHNAQILLQRPFYVEGIVTKGFQRGRQIGFPTANIQSSFELLPGHGVYGGLAHVRGQRVWAVANVGRNPTFGDLAHSQVEVHLLDFNQDIYGETLRFDFLSRLRDEKKFSSVDELKQQIQDDVQFWRNENLK